MRGSFRAATTAFLLVVATGLAGCESAEERAEAHYQRAMALLAEGDVDRALVEFRNVFRLDGNHAEARLAYAGELVERGEIEEAIGQYLRLVEQDWSNLEGHKRLAELGLAVQDFETAATHADRAYALAPADAEVRALKATLDFRRGNRAAAVAMAEEVLKEAPDSPLAQRILIADRLEAGDFDAALARIEAAIAVDPYDWRVQFMKLDALLRLGDRAGVGAQRARLAELFPDNAELAEELVRWHLEEGDTATAETLLRERAAIFAEGTPERLQANLALVAVLYAAGGPEAARAELERLAAAAGEGAAAHPYLRALAGLAMEAGETDRAITTLEAILAEAEPSPDRRDTAVVLAGFLAEAGRAEEAAGHVEAVLAEDPTHVEALKLRARWAIDGDRPDDAIRDLRVALNQMPRDADILTLMAAAHERAGAHELAGERLAVAVEVSNGAPAEAIRYARFLMRDGRTGPAEAVIAAALRNRPADPSLLMALGEIHLAGQDWARAEEVARRLRAAGTPEADALAATLEANALRGQDRFAETIAMIEGLAGQAGPTPATADVVETYLMAGDFAGARAYVDGLLAGRPDDPGLRTIRAGLTAMTGDAAAAEEEYRAVVAAAPDFVPAYTGLYRLLVAAGRSEDAAALIEAGLAATGEHPDLLFIAAGAREAAGDFDGAIALYEDLYARDTASTLIANNLASLIASHRGDAESLARAFAIARRLRGTEVPQFADTYGWILARRGDYAEALPYLERAAAGLPDDPLVQYHLGVAQARLGRPAEARESLGRALAITGAESTLPQVAEARALMAELGGEIGAAEPEAAPEAGN